MSGNLILVGKRHHESTCQSYECCEEHANSIMGKTVALTVVVRDGGLWGGVLFLPSTPNIVTTVTCYFVMGSVPFCFDPLSISHAWPGH